MIRAFPYTEPQWLVDRMNHVHVKGELMDRYRGQWSVEWDDDGTSWLCAQDGTAAAEFLKSMVEQAADYPVLNEMDYGDAQFQGWGDALRPRLDRLTTGTIMSVDEALDRIFLSDLEFIEDEPMVFVLDATDEELRQVLEGEEE